MTIFANGANCFKAREMGENTGEFARLIQIMRDRGVKVQVLDDSGLEKTFCIN